MCDSRQPLNGADSDLSGYGFATDERDMDWHRSEDGSPCACIEEEHDAAPRMVAD